MTRSLAVACVASITALAGCAPAQTYPLSASADEGRALFPALLSCAADRKLEAVQHPSSVNVRTVPGAWAQFMAQGSAFALVVVVEDTSGGPEGAQRLAASAKSKGDELFACAVAQGPRAGTGAPQASGTTAPATTAQAPSPPAAGAPPAATAPAAPPATTASASAPAAPGGPNPMDGFARALGKGLGAIDACTRLTACRTRLSGEVCLATDKACLDAINKGDEGGPDGCGRSLERARTAAMKYKKSPTWQLPDECK